MDSFENINDHIVCTKAKSKTEALNKRDQAREIAQEGKNVAIIFGKRYHLYLAPGHDPYQVRKDIDLFLNPPKSRPKSNPESAPGTASKPKNTPTRDADGKFVSKKQSVLESDSPAEEPPKKKSIWDSLR